MNMEINENDADGCLVFFASLVMTALLMGFGFWLGRTDIRSKNKIEPVIRVEIEDGRADTIFIYKRP